MQSKSDAQLLRDYAEHGAETAFTEIVTRHTSLVYSAALRQVDSPDIAAEVAQSVFIGLARGARSLSPRLAEDASLAGWLCRSARNISLNLRRDESRRNSRERQAMIQIDPIPETAPDWEQLRPVLDKAMSELDEPDYDALVMRFFKNQDLRAVGLALGVSDDTAQKRVSRALDKLREHLSRRGIRTTTAAALSITLSANAVQAAPVGLAVTISTAAALTGTTIASAATATATKAIAMTTLQKTIVGAALAAAIGTGIYEARQASQLRKQIQPFQQQQAALTEQVRQLMAENERVSNLLAQSSLSNDQSSELSRLRGEIAQLRSGTNTERSSRSNSVPPALAGLMARGIAMQKKEWEEEALGQLASMKDKLRLPDEQAEAIRDLLLKRVELQTQVYASGSTRSNILSWAERAEMGKAIFSTEPQIKALLTPGQQAAYVDYQKELAIARGRARASSELAELQNTFSLTVEQQDKIYPTLYDVAVKDFASHLLNPPRSYYDELGRNLEQSTNRLNQKLEAFRSVLAESQLEQLEKYRKSKERQIDLLKRGMETWESLAGKTGVPPE